MGDTENVDDDAYSSRTYGTSSHLTNFLWNNVTYHNEHHKYPGIPFYNLRSFHEAAYPYYDERVKAAATALEPEPDAGPPPTTPPTTPTAPSSW